MLKQEVFVVHVRLIYAMSSVLPTRSIQTQSSFQHKVSSSLVINLLTSPTWLSPSLLQPTYCDIPRVVRIIILHVTDGASFLGEPAPVNDDRQGTIVQIAEPLEPLVATT